MTEALLLLAAAALVTYVTLAFVAWRFGDRLILPAPGSSYRPATLDGLRPVRTSDGIELAALHLPNRDARFTILYSHGNGEDLGNILPVLEALHAMGFAVLAYDYRGYGASGGRPSVEGVLLDAEAAYDHVTRELGVAADRLILWGRSVGGGPAFHLAAKHAVAGVVLEATFTSAFCVVTSRRILPFDRLCNLDLLAGIDVPLLFIHGRKDRIVPFAHGVRLHAQASEPKRYLWIDEAGHNDLWLLAADRIGAAVRDFARSLEATGGAVSDSSGARSGSHPRRSPPGPGRRRSA